MNEHSKKQPAFNFSRWKNIMCLVLLEINLKVSRYNCKELFSQFQLAKKPHGMGNSHLSGKI